MSSSQLYKIKISIFCPSKPLDPYLLQTLAVLYYNNFTPNVLITIKLISYLIFIFIEIVPIGVVYTELVI